ncbi:hypothetical protein NW754_004468 [Fusarium falciforme]|uniref:Uncharacterized protein n=1 Tax=Fusarium falciforme TaxID=195108 RepID=A0A9W8V2A6_9HYPO|nr:hypothetical protein NW754_004468 [Fusarium falciforme]KAJ4190179.1 hypothetical protein NW755_005318 [Fusarium falciforme]
MKELTEFLVGLDSTSSTRESTTLDAYRFESGATRAMASAFSQHERRSKLPSALGRTAFPPLFLFPRTMRSPVESGLMKHDLVYERSINAILQAGSCARLMKWRDFAVLTCNI